MQVSVFLFSDRNEIPQGFDAEGVAKRQPETVAFCGAKRAERSECRADADWRSQPSHEHNPYRGMTLKAPKSKHLGAFLSMNKGITRYLAVRKIDLLGYHIGCFKNSGVVLEKFCEF